MISAKELREFVSSKSKSGFTIEEVNRIINSAADTIDAQENENQKLYHQRDVLAENIEKYRKEEDSIKTALITAQMMADRIKKDSTNEANKLISQSKENATNTVNSAKAQAEKIINEAREYSNTLINQKKQEADSIIIDAEKKSNEAINSSQIVAQNILDQAKEISDELINKSQEEKEAYEQLSSTLAGNAEKFIENLKKLYSEQLDALNSAKIFSSNKPVDEEKLNSAKNDVGSLVNEIGDIKKSIPKEVKIEKTPQPEAAPEPVKQDAAPAETKEEKTDPMDAVKAFSTDEMTPIDKSKPVINEIREEAEPEEDGKSLFDEKLPFENYFHVNNEDAHLDKTQTISLISPEEQSDGNSDDKKQSGHKKKGLFKKKK